MSKPGPKKKSKTERKYPVTIYITGDRIQELGGIEKARNLALTVLNSAKNIVYN